MRRLSIILLALLLWAPEVLGQFVAPGGTIPAVANLPGRRGTLWRSDVNVLNINPADTSIVMLLLPDIADGEQAFEPQVSEEILVPAGTQITMANVLQTEFGMVNTKGALSVFTLDGAPVVISSRTYTVAEEGGTFGQEVAGTLVANTGWVSGVRHDSLFRTNIGVFLPSDPTPGESIFFTVTAYSADGTEVGSGSVFFEFAGLQQRGLDAFGVGTLLDGYVVITCSDTSLIWYGYASIVDNLTGDSVYRAAVGRQGDLPR